MLFVLVMIVIVVVVSVMTPLSMRGISDEITSLCLQLPVLFIFIFIAVTILYFVMYGVKQSKSDMLNTMRDYASTPALTFLVTLGIGIASIVLTSNEVVKRVGIAFLAVVGCWLITFPNFIRQEMGKRLHTMIDTGVVWTDPIYTGIGILLFGAALMMQYFFIDAPG